MFTDQTLLKTALRVLVAWSNWRQPVPADVAILRDAFPGLSDLPEDELACQVVHDINTRVFPQRPPNAQPQAVEQLA